MVKNYHGQKKKMSWLYWIFKIISSTEFQNTIRFCGKMKKKQARTEEKDHISF